LLSLAEKQLPFAFGGNVVVLSKVVHPFTHSIQQISMRTILLQHGEDGFITAECPSLPGCISQGATREEAIANIQDAIALYIKSMREDGELVPPDTIEYVSLEMAEVA
jgi:predicted RNase H-like HicB family nuclease